MAPLTQFVAASAILSAAAVNPVQKVVMLLSDLEKKITADGEAEAAAYAAYEDWCNNAAKDKGFEITTAKSEIEDLTATISKAKSDIMSLSSKIEDLGSSIATNEADLKAATDIRQKENTEYVAVEQELVDTVDTLERAINILERKLHGSGLLQATVDRKDINQLVQTLNTIVDAASMSLHDKKMLIGLVQNNEQSDDSEDADDVGAPAASAYKGHSKSIVDVLEDLKQKAMTQLQTARNEEVAAAHNFALLKQSLDDQVKVDEEEMNEAKGSKHDAAGTKVTAEGDLTVTEANLEDAEKVLKNMKSDCATKAADHESTLANRADELKAIAEAQKVLMEMTGGAQGETYSAASFLQLAGGQEQKLTTSSDLTGFEVVNLVRKMAREQKSAELAQLAQRISSAMKGGATEGQDPFVKVRSLISDMIARLEKEAGAEAQHKAYCDKEYSATKQKLGELKYDIEKYSSKIDKSKATSALLKDEVATLQSEIAEITKVQAEADKLRQKENKIYVQAKADLEAGLQGVRMALKILREYYANEDGSASLVQQPTAPEVHSKASGASSGIIGLLEVVQSDFGKTLASAEMNEEAAATAYQRLSMENKLSLAMKGKDSEYKDKEAAGLDKTVAELTSDRDTTQSELDAVLEYSAKIRDMCEVKPESYEERKARREAELAGLKEALQILDGDAVFLQRRSRNLLRSHM